MTDQVIQYLKAGYDIHFYAFKTETGLHHPKAHDACRMTLIKRIPGMIRKGGSAYSNADIPWKILKDPRAMEEILETHRRRVDRLVETEKNKKP